MFAHAIDILAFESETIGMHLIIHCYYAKCGVDRQPLYYLVYGFLTSKLVVDYDVREIGMVQIS